MINESDIEHFRPHVKQAKMHDSTTFAESEKLNLFDCCGFALVSYSKKDTLEKHASAQHNMPSFWPIANALTQTLDIVD